MATLTISLNSTPLTGSKTYTTTDAEVSRLIAYLQHIYGGTPQQALISWTNDWVRKVVQDEQATTVVQTVSPPISLT